MRIVVTTPFLHGRTAFGKDGKYEGPEGVLTYFVMSGWAREATADDPGPFLPVSKEDLSADAPTPLLPASDVTLEVHDVSVPKTTDHAEVKHG